MTEIDLDRLLVASTSEYDDFLKSNVWNDMRLELEDRLESARNHMEKLDEHLNISRTQGGIEEIRFLLGFPEVLREEAHKQREEDKKRGE